MTVDLKKKKKPGEVCFIWLLKHVLFSSLAYLKDKCLSFQRTM